MYEISVKGGLFRAISISASGLTAQRRKINAIASNMANVETTRAEDGQPYRRKQVVFSADKGEKPFTGVLKDTLNRLKVTRSEHLEIHGEADYEGPEGQKVTTDIIRETPQVPRLVYDPEHPDADANGFVEMPDINPLVEMVDLLTATRQYEANVTVLRAATSMVMRALEI